MEEENVKFFKENGYCILKSVIPQYMIDFIKKYALFDEIQNFKTDAQVPGYHSKYGDPAMESLLLMLRDTIEKNSGFKLYPTFSYYRVYRNGSNLPVHKDREIAEISGTLCLGHNYKDEEYQWPIYFEGIPCPLKQGDMAIYKGIEMTHWRDELQGPENCWHIQGFFHYVNANGPWAHLKYDGRKHIGAKR